MRTPPLQLQQQPQTQQRLPIMPQMQLCLLPHMQQAMATVPRATSGGTGNEKGKCKGYEHEVKTVDGRKHQHEIVSQSAATVLACKQFVEAHAEVLCPLVPGSRADKKRQLVMQVTKCGMNQVQH